MIIKTTFADMPTYDFNCRLVYYTPCGYRRHSFHKTRAIAADLAIEIAERQLRSDKRRRVARVSYGEAIQQ